MRELVCKRLFFLLCLVAAVSLSSVRSPPVYGKLDFLLVDGRPWWHPWHGMIEEVIAAGNAPIISDRSTSTVLRAVFAQDCLNFRWRDSRFAKIDVAEIIIMNQVPKKIFPAGALSLLLGDENRKDRQATLKLLTEAAVAMAADQNRVVHYPYRCVINLRPFKPSWVPTETGHWSTQWAEPAWFYNYDGLTGVDMITFLQNNPPRNCQVFF